LIEVIAMSQVAMRAAVSGADRDAKCEVSCGTSTLKGVGTHSGIDPGLMAKVDAVIEKYKGQKGALIPVLHQVQEIIGYLPRSVQSRIADGLGVPESEVYGVVTFYSFFTMKPTGRHKIGVCLGTACYVKGAAAVLEAVKKATGTQVGDVSEDGRFGLEVTRCLGACGLAPVLTVDGEVYSRVTPDLVPEILAKYE